MDARARAWLRAKAWARARAWATELELSLRSYGGFWCPPSLNPNPSYTGSGAHPHFCFTGSPIIPQRLERVFNSAVDSTPNGTTEEDAFAWVGKQGASQGVPGALWGSAGVFGLGLVLRTRNCNRTILDILALTLIMTVTLRLAQAPTLNLAPNLTLTLSIGSCSTWSHLCSS